MIYAHKRNLVLLFLHICRNCETALIHCLIVLIFLRGIVVFICVCSIARAGRRKVQMDLTLLSLSIGSNV